MPSAEEKEPQENITDKFRSLCAPKDPQNKKNALPPKTHFSIWYFFIMMLLIIYVQQYVLSRNVETIPYCNRLTHRDQPGFRKKMKEKASKEWPVNAPTKGGVS